MKQSTKRLFVVTHSLSVGQEDRKTEGEPTRKAEKREKKRRITTKPTTAGLGRVFPRSGSLSDNPSRDGELEVSSQYLVHQKSCFGYVKKLGTQKKVFWMSLEKFDD